MKKMFMLHISLLHIKTSHVVQVPEKALGCDKTASIVFSNIL